MSREDPTHGLSAMSGEQLRNEGRRRDRQLGKEIDRLRLGDEQFRRVLDRSLAVEDEQARRRNP
jgi:hypothetical protein